jgi:very-short-patch-repair endonuclease
VDADGQRMAAVLACGAGAVLSHRAAGALWELRPSARAVVEVTAARALRPIAGVERHRAVLADAETTTRRGIAVTTPSRTLLDLAGVLDRHAFERALEQVELRRLHDATPLGVLLDRHPRAPGAGMARRALAAQRPGITRSELEQRFLAFLDAHRLPRPRVNAYVEGLEVDAVWASARLVVELDGGAFHTTRQAFERDRRRDRALVAAGWRVVRITWRQLHEEPAAVAADLRALLAA